MDHPFLLISTRLRSYSLSYPNTLFFFFFFEKNPRIPRFSVLINRLRSALEVRASLVLAGRWCWFFLFYSFLLSVFNSVVLILLLQTVCSSPFLLFTIFFMIFSGENTGLETDAMKARCGIFMLPAGLGLLS